ncbi:MAG: alpha/beta hydrolase [Candidatus Hodarchaeales archaeon]
MPEQKRTQSSYLIVIILIIFSGTGLISIFMLNSNFGTVDISLVKIPNRNSFLTGLLYAPIDVSGDNPLPTVICAHGFSNSKQAMSGLALELGRRGFVALALDLAGHGGSDPSNNDSTLGILSAIDYLDTLPYADTSSIGVAGHSMGAGATWATALEHGNITASVLIGGLPDLSTEGTNNGKYNATFPKNVLVAVGEYDEFFGDVSSLNTELMGLFGTTNPVVPNYVFYGSFLPERQDARRLVVSETIHIFEPIDPLIVTETIQWMQTALKMDSYLDDYYIPHDNLIYTFRDIASLITLISIVCVLLSLLPLVYNLYSIKEERNIPSFDFMKPPLKRTSVIWGTLVIVLYFPVMLIGMFIPVPPMTFASSIALWFVLINSVLFALVYKFSSYFGVQFSLKKVFRKDQQAWQVKQGIGLACGIIAGLYVIIFLIEAFLSIHLGFIITLFSNLLVLPRIISFVILLPVFIIYFVIDGFLFHTKLNNSKGEVDYTEDLLGLGKLLLAKAWPFILLVTCIYVPRIFFEINLLPGGLIALSIQFFWVMGLFFLTGSMISWFWYRQSNSLLPGAVFNSLLFVWILSSILPV